MADQWLGAITDEEGNFLTNPEKSVTWGSLIGDPSLIQPAVPGALTPPDEILGPVVQYVRRLSWIARLGAAVIRLLGVDQMPVWLLMLLTSDLILALLIILLLK